MGPTPTLSPTEFDAANGFLSHRGIAANRMTEMMYPPQMPLHSMMVGTWLTAGILGLPFWLFVLRRAVDGFLGHLRGSHVEMFFCVFLLWSLFFSPMGSWMRLFLGIGIAMCLTKPLRIGGPTVPTARSGPEVLVGGAASAGQGNGYLGGLPSHNGRQEGPDAAAFRFRSRRIGKRPHSDDVAAVTGLASSIDHDETVYVAMAMDSPSRA
jgi:hypothetical protein